MPNTHPDKLIITLINGNIYIIPETCPIALNGYGQHPHKNRAVRVYDGTNEPLTMFYSDIKEMDVINQDIEDSDFKPIWDDYNTWLKTPIEEQK